MTTFVEITKKCYACNKASTHKEISSTNAFGSPDLDTRPPEMERSTIDMWIEMCPSCGYSSADISEGNEKVLDVIDTDSYQEQINSPEYPKLANAFLCFSLIQENNCEYMGAGWSSVHAAWACDDADFETGAQKCRMRAVSLFRKGKENNQKFAKQKGVEEVIIIDLLRRSSQFELAFSMCEEVLKKKPEKIISKIMKLQKILINNKDVACHLMADVREVPIEIEPIIEELKDEDDIVRRNAAEELGETKDAKAVGPLIEALKDKDLRVRMNAADALGKIRDARAVEPLIKVLRDKDYNIRMNAAEALGRIKDERAVEPLIEALKDEDNIFLNIQWKAADALCEIGGERVIELLVQGLKDENKGVREGAAYALGKIKDCKKYKKGILHRICDLLRLNVDKKFQ